MYKRLHDLHNIENTFARLAVSLQNQHFSKYYYDDMYTIDGSDP